METKRRWLQLRVDLAPGAEKLRDYRDDLDNVLDAIDTLVDAASAAELVVLLAVDPVTAVLSAGIELIDNALARVERVGAACLVVPAVTASSQAPAYDRLGPTNVLLGLNAGDDPTTALRRDATVDSPVQNFYNVVEASLEDTGDANRPQYPDDHVVAGMVLLVGAPSAVELLRKVSRLEALWGELTTVPIGALAVPQPKNLEVLTFRPVMGPISGLEWGIQEWLGGRPVDLDAAGMPREGTVEVGATGFAAVLRWDAPPLGLNNVLSLTNVLVEVIETRVYLKEGSDFDQLDRASRLSSLQVARLSSRSTHAALNGLDPDTVYYVAVGFVVRVRQLDSELNVIAEDVLDTPRLSNSVTVRQADSAAPLPQGVLPDWVGVNSPLEIAPPVVRLLQRARALLQEIQDNIIGSKLEEFRAFVELVRRKLARLRQLYTEFLALYDEVVAFLELLSADVYAYAFYGTGGTRLVQRELWHALLDPRTQSRPEFNDATAAVSGLVLVTGAAAPSGISAFLELLELFLGPTGARESIGGDVTTRTSEPAQGSAADADPLRELTIAVEALEARRAEVLAAAELRLGTSGAAERSQVTPAGPC